MAKKKTNCLTTNTFFMDWTFEEFRAELDTLNPSVRKKAIEIAKKLIEKEGFSREKAYSLVQKNAQNSWKKSINFYESLANDKDIKNNISKKDLNKMFDVNYHTKKVNSIFKRVFKKNE